MKDIVRSITKNGKQVLKTILFSIVVIYIYAFVAFTYFPEDYKHDYGD